MGTAVPLSPCSLPSLSLTFNFPFYGSLISFILIFFLPFFLSVFLSEPLSSTFPLFPNSIVELEYFDFILLLKNVKVTFCYLLSQSISPLAARCILRPGVPGRAPDSVAPRLLPLDVSCGTCRRSSLQPGKSALAEAVQSRLELGLSRRGTAINLGSEAEPT